MKRLSLILLCLILILSALSACAQNKTDDRPLIVTSVFPLYEFASVLSDGQAEVRLLLPPGSDLHSYEPTPQDIAMLSSSDLFLYVGGEGDQHLEKILQSAPDVCTLSFEDLLNTCAKTHADHDHEKADHHHEQDEHIWTSPKKALSMLHTLADTLCTLWPEWQTSIRTNEKSYAEKLQNLDRDYRAAADSLPTLIFGDRFPFLHLAVDYGLHYFAALDGCGEHTEPSAARLAELIELAEGANCKTVFYTETSSGELARSVADSCSASVARVHSCHNLSADEWNQNVTYLDLMQENLTILKQA